MRIARLDLAAFGPFTDRCLDLSGGAPGGLHLVYGRNAAGKSSALRAISDLLFGIPPKSADDHVHPYAALRIRALLQSSGGEHLLVQRLKRSKDSLRDANDAPLDEAVLRKLLGGVDRALFERVFGLDHERLRHAGQTLLEGGGDVGESLFDAGAGGRGVHRVLVRLREEAERLFKPRGEKQEIAQLLEKYKIARDHVRNAAHAPEAYVEQQRELDRHRAEREDLARQLSELRREREETRLLKAAMQGLAKSERLRADLVTLGSLPELPHDFGERRERVQASLARHQANITRAEREIERLRERSAELRPPEGLLAAGEETITQIREGIGSTKKALVDLPSREAALAERRAEAQVVERQLGVDPSRLTAEALRARRPEEAKFRKLFAERAALGERRRAARERAAQVALDVETQKARLAALPPPGDVEALERAVLFARHVGDVEGALGAARREQSEVELQSQAELAALAPFDGSLADLCTLRVPANETVVRFERGFASLAEQRQRFADAASRCRERARELTRELAAEEQAGAVPSEAELERARGARDEHFDELCKAWPDNPKKGLSLFEAARVRDYRTLVGAADGLADRLRREAARVAENARRTAELAQLGDEQARLAALDAQLVHEHEELAREWASSWSAAGFEPVAPAEMRGWLARRDRAVTLVLKETAIAEREAELSRKAAELAAALTAALGPLPPELPLAVSSERALERLERERRSARDRAALEGQIAELEVRRAAAERELGQAEQESRAREADLRAVVTALGFEASITPEEVEVRLEALADLERAREKTSELERRVSGMKRDLAAFDREVQALVAAHAPELAAGTSQRAATELVQRFDRGRRDAETLARLGAELDERRAELAEQQALLAEAEADARNLLAVANATELHELPALEVRTHRARELRAELDGLEASLSATAGPSGIEGLRARAAATDPARLSARLEELDELVERLEEQHTESIRRHQSIQAGLAQFSDTTAVEAAEEERALASALIERSERWAKFKLAEFLLAREIERYREQNQGPVLRRAAELFRRLTREAYRGLRLGREERALVAVRADDLEVGVEGLNEAARYHLYLALRLASLERYLEHAEPLPLVLDDVLMPFDDDGATAALGVLGETAERLQILLLTHHRHNVSLAESAVPRERLFVHEL